MASRWVRAEATLADGVTSSLRQSSSRATGDHLRADSRGRAVDWTGEPSDPRWRTFVSDLHRLTKAATDRDHAAANQALDKPQPAPVSKVEDASDSEQPAARQSLRPGNDEVIFAAPTRRDPPVQSPAAEEPNAVDAPSPSEVHCLEIEGENGAAEPILVDSSGVKIGRTAPADIVLPHKSISREHCLIGLANDELLVTDLNSTNGTFVDDARISRATVCRSVDFAAGQVHCGTRPQPLGSGALEPPGGR